MKYLLIFLFILAFMVGCAKDKPKSSFVKNTKLLSTPIVNSSKIKLFKQYLPVKKEILHKAYKKLSPKLGLSNLSDFQGIFFKNEFIFDDDTTPFVEYRFDKPYIMKKIYLKDIGFVVDGSNEGSNIKKFELLFLDAKHTPIYVAQLDKDAKYIDGFDSIQAEGFILKIRTVYTDGKSNVDVKQIKANFDPRVEVEVIDPDYIYDIVKPVLTSRASKTSNEELLKTVALMNMELFKRLRKRRMDFNLPKKSLLYLPDDADMNYAIAHTQEVYKTGKYKTIKGKYKIFIFSEEADFDSGGKVKIKKHKIKLPNSHRNIKTTTKLPENKKFIDFSEGI